MLVLQKLRKIFKLLEIENYKDISFEILKSNCMFFESFFSIGSVKQTNEHPEENSSISIEAANFKQNTKQQTFNIHKYEDCEKYAYFAKTSDDHSFIGVFIKKESGYAFLKQICLQTDPDPIKKGLCYPYGTAIFLCILSYLQNNKNSLGIDRIVLIENSEKILKDGRSISLPIVYTLMYGDTFYGKYNFRPAEFDGRLDISKNEQYEENKQIMKIIRVYDVPQLENYILKACTELKMNVKNIRSILDSFTEFKKRKALLSEFIKYFIRKYDREYVIFNYFCWKLEGDIGLVSFQGQELCKIL